MNHLHHWHYIGAPDIRLRAQSQPVGTAVRTVDDIIRYLDSTATSPAPPAGTSTICTYVVDAAGTLRLAPRRSEHVACAGGHPVLAAGEITFHRHCEQTTCLTVSEVSNLSLGYCPEPDACLEALREALDAADVPHPQRLTSAYHFRRCPACGQLNTIKDDTFLCAACDAELPDEWNLGATAAMTTVAERLAVAPAPFALHLTAGVSRNLADTSVQPVYATRHAPEGTLSGWFVWRGEYSDADDFFEPVCTHCLVERCPGLEPYLFLPPGYGVIRDDSGFEDVWFDEKFLAT
ncbi:MAG: hypothetical protein AB7K09_12365 [Planctomycetota bacterium]